VADSCEESNEHVGSIKADPDSRAVSRVALRPVAYWDCGFESRRGHGCFLRVLCVVR
jgi:hypothetical protein